MFPSRTPSKSTPSWFRMYFVAPEILIPTLGTLAGVVVFIRSQWGLKSFDGWLEAIVTKPHIYGPLMTGVLPSLANAFFSRLRENRQVIENSKAVNTDDTDRDRAFEKGQQAFTHGQYIPAAGYFAKAREYLLDFPVKDKNYYQSLSKLYYIEGKCWYLCGQLRKAHSLLTLSAFTDGNNMEALLLDGILAFRLQAFEQAKNNFKRVFSLNRMQNMSYLFWQFLEDKDSIVTSHNPHDSNASAPIEFDDSIEMYLVMQMLGECYLKQENIELALRHFHAALELMPKAASYLPERAFIKSLYAQALQKRTEDLSSELDSLFTRGKKIALEDSHETVLQEAKDLLAEAEACLENDPRLASIKARFQNSQFKELKK